MIRTHKFKLGKYKIEFVGKIGGMTDVPEEIKDGKPIQYVWKDCDKQMFIVANGGIDELDSTIHEALHAQGVPDEYLHDKDGNSTTRTIAHFLWKIGYRK